MSGSPEINRELDFILAVIRSFLHNREELDESVQFNTNSLYRELRRHRLEMLYKKIQFQSEQALQVQHMLEKDLLAIRARQLALVHELTVVSKWLFEHSIDYLSFKGPVLSKIAYNDEFFRTGRDIDIIVPEDKVIEIQNFLFSRGFQSERPDKAGGKLFGKYLKMYTQAEYRHPKLKISIEIHWQLFNNRHLLPAKLHNLIDYKTEEIISNQKIAFLGMQYQFVYLCIHGTQHNWSRLFWLLDIAVMVQKYTEKSFYEGLVEQTHNLKAERSVGAAMSLIKELFFVEIPEPLQEFINYKNVELLASNAMHAIDSARRKKMPLFGSLRIISTNLKMKAGVRYKIQYFIKQWISYHDWKVLPLPAALFWLYFPLRPFLWLYRNIFR